MGAVCTSPMADRSSEERRVVNPGNPRTIPPKPGRRIIRFEVEDTGIGIRPENREIIFDHFMQITDADKRREGVGLGLTICHHYAELMGGSVALESRPGKGSAFTVELPVEIVDDPGTATGAPTRRVIGLEPGLPEFRVLIVEDDPDNRSVLRQLLENVGFNVIEATNGREAVERWKHDNPALIWMDIRLPVMDGMEATRRIRELESRGEDPSNHSPIIALTASVFEEDKSKVLAAGCDDFLRKPFHEEEIFDKMARFLDIRYIRGEAEERDEEIVNPRAVVPSDLAGLTADWIARCREAAMKGRSVELGDLITEIRDGHGRAADALAEMVRKYQFSKIVAFSKKGATMNDMDKVRMSRKLPSYEKFNPTDGFGAVHPRLPSFRIHSGPVVHGRRVFCFEKKLDRDIFLVHTIHMFSIKELTSRQAEILKFIQEFQYEEGVAPTYREIAGHFGFKSPRSALDHVRALEKKGYVRGHGGRSRGIEVLTSDRAPANDAFDVPVLGAIPAGFPEERTGRQRATLVVDRAILGDAPMRGLFALKVNGESMTGRGIHNGDWVVADAKASSREGDVVVALVDGESTLKTLVKQEGRFFLKAESPNHTDVTPKAEMVIQGVVRALLRRI